MNDEPITDQLDAKRILTQMQTELVDARYEWTLSSSPQRASTFIKCRRIRQNVQVSVSGDNQCRKGPCLGADRSGNYSVTLSLVLYVQQLLVFSE